MRLVPLGKDYFLFPLYFLPLIAYYTSYRYTYIYISTTGNSSENRTLRPMINFADGGIEAVHELTPRTLAAINSSEQTDMTPHDLTQGRNSRKDIQDTTVSFFGR